jgi:hypothetical protein
MTGQHINLTTDFFPTRLPNASCLIFFADPHFLKTILAHRTSGTFGYVLHTSPTLRKTKRDTFYQATHTLFISINEIYLPLMITFNDQYYFGYEQN